MSEKKNKLSRRQLLQRSAIAAGGVSLNGLGGFLGTILNAHFNQALAADSDKVENEARNYVMIQLPGAPPRWSWDPLVPFDKDSDIIVNNQVGTRFRPNGQQDYKAVEYRSININGINMPWMWKFPVAKSGSGERSLSELMDNMLLIRGLNCNNPAHTAARALQFNPGGSKYSLTALVADMNKFPISHVAMSSSNAPFVSKENKARVSISNGGNMIDKLLSPFKDSTSSTYKNNHNKISDVLNDAIENFMADIKDAHPSNKAIENAQKNAIKLTKIDFNNLTSQWDKLKNKYQDIINRTLVNKSGLQFLTDERAGESDSTIRLDYLADYFAVTEYVLINKLSSSIAFRVRRNVTMDEHTLDAKKSLNANVKMNRSLAACVLELKDALQKSPHGDLFAETLIQIAGEFGRNPRHSATGSDHSPAAGSVTLISGALVGNEVVGHITKGGSSGDRRGTYGVQAFTPGVGYLTDGHLANTVADILRVPRPLTAVGSIVEEVSDGKFKSTLPPGRLV